MLQRTRLVGIGSGSARPLEFNYKAILDNVASYGLNCVRFTMCYDLRVSLSESCLSKVYDFCNYARGKGIVVVQSLSHKRVSSDPADWPRQEEIITRIYNRLKGLDNIIYETGNELTQGYSYEIKIVKLLRGLGVQEIMSSALRDQSKVKPYVDYFSYHKTCGTGAVNKEMGAGTVYDTDGCSLSTLTPSVLYEAAKKAFQRGSHFFFDEGLKRDGSFTDISRMQALRRASNDVPIGVPPPPTVAVSGWTANLLSYPGFRGQEDLAGWTLAYGRIHIYCQPGRGRTGPCEATDAEVDPTEIYQIVNISRYAGFIDEKLEKAKIGVWVRKTSPTEKVRLIYEYREQAGRILASYDTGWLTGIWYPNWRLYEDKRIVPANTRTIKVRLLWGYKIGTTNDNNMTDSYVQLFTDIEQLNRMIAQLQGQIAPIDKRIEELRRQIEALKAEIARTKEILGG